MPCGRQVVLGTKAGKAKRIGAGAGYTWLYSVTSPRTSQSQLQGLLQPLSGGAIVLFEPWKSSAS